MNKLRFSEGKELSQSHMPRKWPWTEWKAVWLPCSSSQPQSYLASLGLDVDSSSCAPTHALHTYHQSFSCSQGPF